MIASPRVSESKQAAASLQLSPRLKACWEHDIDWDVLPSKLSKVRTVTMPQTFDTDAE